MNRVPLLTRVPSTTCRLYSTKIVDTKAPELEEEIVEEPPGIFRRFWRWLNSDDGELEVCKISEFVMHCVMWKVICDLVTFCVFQYQMSEEERQERDDMMAKVCRNGVLYKLKYLGVAPS